MTKQEFLSQRSLVAKLAQAVIDTVHTEYDGLGVSESLVLTALEEQGVPDEHRAQVIEICLSTGSINRGPKGSLLPACRLPRIRTSCSAWRSSGSRTCGDTSNGGSLRWRRQALR